jgi:hypothetical protein
MAFTARFQTKNAAFESSEEQETARILREIADKLDDFTREGNVFDANGNKIGTFRLS